MIYLLTAIGLTPGGSSTVHIYTQTIHMSHTQWLELHFVCVCIVLVNSVDARGRKTMVLGVVGDSEWVKSEGHTADLRLRRRSM